MNMKLVYQKFLNEIKKKRKINALGEKNYTTLADLGELQQ